MHYDHTVRDCDGAVVQFQYGDAPSTSPRWATNQISRFSPITRNSCARTSSAPRLARRRSSRTRRIRRCKPEVPVTARGPRGVPWAPSPRRFGDALDAFLAKTHPGFFAEKGFLRGEEGYEKSKNPRKSRHVLVLTLLILARGGGYDPRRSSAADELAVPQFSGGARRGCGLRRRAIRGRAFDADDPQHVPLAGRGEANVTLGIPRLRELHGGGEETRDAGDDPSSVAARARRRRRKTWRGGCGASAWRSSSRRSSSRKTRAGEATAEPARSPACTPSRYNFADRTTRRAATT